MKNHLNHCLKRDGFTWTDYLDEHGDVLYQPHHSLVQKFRKLIGFSMTVFGWHIPFRTATDEEGKLYRYPLDPYRWGSLETDDQWGYFQVNTDCWRPWYGRSGFLGRTYRILEAQPLDHGLEQGRGVYRQFATHFQGRGTLAIRPDQTNRFLCIDVDVDDFPAIQRLTRQLDSRGVECHVEFSGNKGYHIWIFFDQDVPREQLAQLADWIRLHTKIKIDLIYPLNRKLLKLPLGIHQKAGNLAGFVDPDTGRVLGGSEQLSVLESIQQQPFPSVGSFEIETHEPASLPEPDSEEKAPVAALPDPESRDQAWIDISSRELFSFLASGSKLNGSRHQALFRYAVLLRDQENLCMEKAEQTLLAWSGRVHSKRSLKEREHDVKETVKRVYRKRITHKPLKLEEVTELEMKTVERCVSEYISAYGLFGSLKRREDRTKRMNSLRKVARVLISLAKSKDSFQAGHRYIGRLTGLSRQTVDDCMRILVEDAGADFLEDPSKADDPILRADPRALRRGCLLICVERGSFPENQRSKYRIKPQVAEALGWVTRDCSQERCWLCENEVDVAASFFEVEDRLGRNVDALLCSSCHGTVIHASLAESAQIIELIAVNAPVVSTCEFEEEDASWRGRQDAPETIWEAPAVAGVG